MRPASSAALAASRAARGAGAEGWPTSIWTTLSPSPFFRRGGAQHIHGKERRDALHAARDRRASGSRAGLLSCDGSYPLAGRSLKNFEFDPTKA